MVQNWCQKSVRAQRRIQLKHSILAEWPVVPHRPNFSLVGHVKPSNKSFQLHSSLGSAVQHHFRSYWYILDREHTWFRKVWRVWQVQNVTYQAARFRPHLSTETLFFDCLLRLGFILTLCAVFDVLTNGNLRVRDALEQKKKKIGLEARSIV